MNMVKYIYHSLYGAWRLTRFDPAGLACFDQTVGGFWRSFLAALVGLPFFLLLSGLEKNLRATAMGIIAPGEKLDQSHYFLLQTLDYLAIWPAFALVMILFCRGLKLGDRYVALIVSYNWARAVSVAILIPPYLMLTVGSLTSVVEAAVTVAASIFILVYQWFVAKTALGSALAGVAVVMTDILLAVAVSFAMTHLFNGFFIGFQ